MWEGNGSTLGKYVGPKIASLAARRNKHAHRDCHLRHFHRARKSFFLADARYQYIIG